MAKRADGLSQQIAADAVGISVCSSQRIDRGELQPQNQQQRGCNWRTRADPLADVWESVLVPMLQKAPQLEPQTLLLHLEQTCPGQEWYRRKRTLQRRVEQWRALHGPAQEVMFLQEHRAGVLGISDFTLLKGEPITVAGEVLEHRLFHFRLPFSGWCHVEVIHVRRQRRLVPDQKRMSLDNPRRGELWRPLRSAAERAERLRRGAG